MITLSGTSVVTSSSRPPAGAGWVTVNVRTCLWPGASARLAGSAVTSLESIRNVPTTELPAERPDDRIARGTGKRDLVGPAGGKRGHKEAEGRRRLEDRPHGRAVKADQVPGSEAAAE